MRDPTEVRPLFPARWQLSRRCKSTLTELEDPYVHAPMDLPAQEGCDRATVYSSCARRTSRTVFIVTILCRGGHLALAAKAWQQCEQGSECNSAEQGRTYLQRTVQRPSLPPQCLRANDTCFAMAASGRGGGRGLCGKGGVEHSSDISRGSRRQRRDS